MLYQYHKQHCNSQPSTCSLVCFIDFCRIAFKMQFLHIVNFDKYYRISLSLKMFFLMLFHVSALWYCFLNIYEDKTVSIPLTDYSHFSECDGTTEFPSSVKNFYESRVKGIWFLGMCDLPSGSSSPEKMDSEPSGTGPGEPAWSSVLQLTLVEALELRASMGFLCHWYTGIHLKEAMRVEAGHLRL